MKSHKEVINSGLCIGCGLCSGLCCEPLYNMEEGNDGFLYPKAVDQKVWADVRNACPGINYNINYSLTKPEERLWGPMKNVLLGNATNEEIRWKGSSGGGITAILIYLLENKIIDAAVQIGPSLNNPLKVDTYLNRNREDIIRCSSSRYCPSSPLAGIGKVFASDMKIAFVGKPCDVVALRQYLYLHPEFKKNIVICLSFFCASTPSYNGTSSILNRIGVLKEDVKEFWYRGRGWPGYATAITNTGIINTLTYAESWGEILSNHAHFRCKICPDGVGFSADISFADGWDVHNGKPVFNEQSGKNIIIVRTITGERIINDAVKLGQLQVKDYNISKIGVMQPSQAYKRKVVGARILALRSCGLFYPKFKGFSIYKNMFSSSPNALLKNYLGTLKRLVKRKK